MDPACRTFLEYLSNCAAVRTADAGNALVEGNNEFQAIADGSKILTAAREFIEKVREPGYQFNSANLKPITVVAPSTYANRPEDRTETFPHSSITPADGPIAT